MSVHFEPTVSDARGIAWELSDFPSQSNDHFKNLGGGRFEDIGVMGTRGTLVIQEAGGRWVAARVALDLTHGDSHDLGTVRLSAGARIVGRLRARTDGVFDSWGGTAYCVDEDASVRFMLRISRDKFESSAAPAGRVRVVADLPGWVVESKEILLEDGVEASVELDAWREGSLVVEVEAPGGSDRAVVLDYLGPLGAVVQWHAPRNTTPMRGGGRLEFPFLRTAVAPDASGVCRIGRLPPGSYRVRMSGGSGLTDGVEVEVPSGTEVFTKVPASPR
jgi:hypothetical protein